MARHPKKIDEAGRMNSLGLTPTRLDVLLDRLDREPDRKVVRRANARWPFRQPSIQVTLTHPGGSQVDVQMACRNLSQTGASLLHAAFVHTDTPCVCSLPHPERGRVQVEGRVVRCQHRGGVIHELGVQFDKPIDLRSFVCPDPLSQLFATEVVEAEMLEGRLLHVEPNEHDANLVRHLLRNTSVRVVMRQTVPEAIEEAHKGVDLILSDFTIGGISGAEFAVQLRSENIAKPLLFLTHDISLRVVNAVKGRMAQAMIRKPVSEATLLPALAEFLRRDTGEGATRGRSVDPSLVESLKPELARCARQLDQGLRDDKPMDVIATCHVLQQVAGVIGLTGLSEDTGKAISRLSTGLELSRNADLLRLIIEQCRRAA
jgi:CheY-like chemotaxis protein